MSLIGNIKKSIFFGFLEQGISILFGIVSSVLIIRNIDTVEYGIYNYILSFLVIVNFINISPGNYIFKIKENKGIRELDNYISSFIYFEFFKGLVLFIINIIIVLVLFFKTNNIIFIIIGVSNGLTVFLRQFVSLFKIILTVNFKQQLITKIVFFATILKLCILLVLLVNNSIVFVLLSHLILNFILVLFFYIAIIKDLGFVFNSLNRQNIFRLNRESIVNYSLSTHFVGVITNLIYKIDPFVLGFFVSMQSIGLYSVSLNTSNYFIIVFQVLQQNASIALANLKSEDDENRVITKFFIVSIILSITQFILFVLFGKIFLGFFVRSNIDIVYRYSYYIILGLSIMNSVRVLSSYIALRASVNRMLFQVTIPSGIFAVIVYFISGYFFKEIGVAIGNVISYSFLSFLILVMLYKTDFKFEI